MWMYHTFFVILNQSAFFGLILLLVCCLWVDVDDINEGDDYDDEEYSNDHDDHDHDDDNEDQVRCLRGGGWRGFPHSWRSCMLQQGPTLPTFLLL